MSLTYGFYNSLKGDRKYNSEQISSIFDGIIEDGVYMSIGDQLTVKSVEGMAVKVGRGRAWFNHTWTLNDSDLLLTVEQSELLMDRIDAVVLEVNASEGVRANEIKIIKGTPASNPVKPTLEKSTYVHQYALAYINVGKNVIEITQANITNAVGTSETPFVTGILQTVSIDNLIAQWEYEWEAWLGATQLEQAQWTNQQRDAWLNWVAKQEEDLALWFEEYQGELDAIKSDMQAYSNAAKIDFETWFASIKGKLSEDAAGNLQVQIDDITEKEFNRYYGLTTKSTIINKDEAGNVESIMETSNEADTTTTFEMIQGTKVITTEIIPNNGQWKYIKLTEIATSDAGLIITESYTKVAK